MFAARKIQFGQFLFDLRDQRLIGPHGQIPLNLKSAEVFAYLVQRPGQIIPKEELLNAVWTGTAVTDDALVQRVLDIRKALGDNSKTPQFIRTHPKRGYEFVGIPVIKGEDESAAAPAAIALEHGKSNKRRWFVASLALVAIAAIVAAVFFARRHVASEEPANLRMAQLTFRSGMEDYPVPDVTGRHLLYSSDESGTPNLWILDQATGERRQITTGTENLSEPDWSSAGDWIAYRSGEGNGGLYAKSLATNEVRRIAPFGHHPRWSPDGRDLAFQTTGARSEIYIWSLKDRTLHKLTIKSPPLQSISWPTWGRDNSAIYFVAIARFVSSRKSRDSQDWVHLGHQIWKMNASGGAAKVVTPGTGILKDGGFDYDPKRSQLVFVGLDRGLWRSEIDADTGKEIRKPVRLTLTTQGHQHPRIDRDGQIAFSAINSEEALWLVPFDASGRLNESGMTRLTTGAASVRGPALSPDGRRMAYFLWQGERFELWLLDLKTRTVQPIGPNDQLSRTSPIWSDDGLSLTYNVVTGKTGELRRAWFAENFSRLTDERRVDEPPPVSERRNWDKSKQFRPYILTNATGQSLWLERKGSTPLRLRGPGHYQSPSWSADGRRIFFQCDEDGWFNIWSIDFDPGSGAAVGGPRQVSFFRGNPYLLSDINLGFAIQPKGLVVPLRENRSDLWLLRTR